jgi:hypothetical protein
MGRFAPGLMFRQSPEEVRWMQDDEIFSFVVIAEEQPESMFELRNAHGFSSVEKSSLTWVWQKFRLLLLPVLGDAGEEFESG